MSPRMGVELINNVCDEVAMLRSTDEIDAIAIAIVLPDGTIRTLHAFSEGTKLPLLAGISILQHDFINYNCKSVSDNVGIIEVRGNDKNEL